MVIILFLIILFWKTIPNRSDGFFDNNRKIAEKHIDILYEITVDKSIKSVYD